MSAVNRCPMDRGGVVLGVGGRDTEGPTDIKTERKKDKEREETYNVIDT